MGEVVAGRVELIDVLASGGGGTVWRAWDHRQSRYRAAKVLRHSDSDSVVRFVQESRRIIEHPHILTARNWFGEDDRVLFTMDLVAGGSVADLLGDFGALPEGWVVELARQTAEALVTVHAAGFVHRDIKPSNLLLDATGRGAPHLRLADFGTCAKIGGPRLTITSAVLGTPGYLSPEARRGADPAPAQDIYALGVVMRQMASGTDPDDHGAPLPVTPELASLIGRMSAEEPSDRPRSAAEVRAELAALPGAGDLASGAADGDPIEVFVHLPPLPAPWGPDGPTGPTGETGPPGPVRAPAASGEPTRPRPTPTTRATPALQTAIEPVRPSAAEPERRAGSAGRRLAQPAAPPPPSAAQSRVLLWPIAALAALGVVLLVLAIALA
ncbi:serine/threonine-protein kinase [Nocardioides sp. GXZ039]|uniref:serine/threonine-protein kinase n=1 Tax=Nocardioides sp. GXZ039 TaxID=3136018 RepID=UPI0030F3754A